DTRYECPARLDDALAGRIGELALAAYRAVGCEGWGRVDVMLRRSDDTPYLLEVNTSPGMTGHSLVPMAARAVGISYEELCLRILASAALKVGGRDGPDCGTTCAGSLRWPMRCSRRRCSPRWPPPHGGSRSGRCSRLRTFASQPARDTNCGASRARSCAR